MSKEIVMIHGWGTGNYNCNVDSETVTSSIAWEHRSVLIKLLEKKYTLRYFNLPGFCGVPEPERASFDLDDFANYFAVWLDNLNTRPTAIVGYSFGGALALRYKVKYGSDIPLVLISPALKRKETVKSHVASIGKDFIPEKYFNRLKDLYQTIFSQYYREGTPFLRASYDKIARRDIRPLLELVNPEDILLIYGDSDESTPADYITEYVHKNRLNCLVISGGDHDIGETHPGEISSAIIDFLSK